MIWFLKSSKFLFWRFLKPSLTVQSKEWNNKRHKWQSVKCIGLSTLMTTYFTCTVELGFKNHQNKNLLDFKNQITNYQIWLLALRTVKIRTCLTLRTKMAVTKKVLKAKFDCNLYVIFCERKPFVCNVYTLVDMETEKSRTIYRPI